MCDSECERLALLAAMRSRPTSQLDTFWTKIVNFQRRLSAKGLERQHRQVTSELQQLIEHEEDRSAFGPPWLRAQGRQVGGGPHTLSLTTNVTRRTRRASLRHHTHCQRRCTVRDVSLLGRAR